MLRTLINSIIAVALLCSADVFAADGNKSGYMLEVVTPYSVRVLKNSCDTLRDNCTKLPVTTGTVSVAYGEARHTITDPLQGVFSLPSSRVGYLESLGKKTDIIWEYEGTRITTTSNYTSEEKQQTIKTYLDKLAAEKLLTLQLGEHSGFDRSVNILFDKIRSSLPKYYRLKRSEKPVTQNPRIAEAQEAPAAYNLVPTQSQMFYKYGDYTGNVELPSMEYSDVPASVVLTTNIINNGLPAYQNEDTAVKIVFKNSALQVTNKSDSPLTLNRVSFYYDGMFFDSLLDHPRELMPDATAEISLASVIEKELKLDEKHSALSAQEAWQKKVSFGFGVDYGKNRESVPVVLGKVMVCSAHGAAESPAETAQLMAHMEPPAREKAPSANVDEKKIDAPAKARYDFTLEFASGEVLLKPEDLEKLDAVGQAMEKNPNIKGIIEGHSDNVGSRAVNQKVSELRAHGAKHYLVKKYAIDPGRIQTKGFGMTKAIAENCTSAGRALNRRIEARFWDYADVIK